MKSFDKFWKEYSKDLDIWNMSLEEYDYHKKTAMQIWIRKSEENTANDIRNKITTAYRKAFEAGTDKAWKSYGNLLKRLAKEADAESPEALEDWAFRTARMIANREV